MSDSFRRCHKCKKKKKLNANNFRRYWSGIGGQHYYHTWCRECEREYQNKRRKKK